MDKGEIGHHHAKCLGPIYSAENLAANSIQLIGNLASQRINECGVNTLKWNVQPRAVIKRNKLCLSGLGFEAHDDVFREGVLSPDFQHSKKLAEMALGDSVIDSTPKLSALLYGRNDSALWSCCGLVCSGHVVPLS
jgi:hypothetical protein